MNLTHMKGVRLPRPILSRIERILKAECTSFSQFMRTAAINELNRRKRVRIDIPQ